MRIAFFTEGNWSGKVSRDNPNMRTEMAWMCALQADHSGLPIRSTNMVLQYVTGNGFFIRT